jgi:hypothetical protein
MRRISALALLCVAAMAGSLAKPASSDARDGRPASLHDRIVDVRQELSSLFEEVQDLGEPVEEFQLFDECMHFLGVSEFGGGSSGSGFVYGNNALMPALAMDMRGFEPPQYQLLAFPGEEPPSIECNEDAGGLFTN